LFIRITNALNLLKKTDSEFRDDKQGVLYVILIGFVRETQVDCLKRLKAGADHYSGLNNQSVSKVEEILQIQCTQR